MERMMALNLNDVERDVLRLRLGLDDGRIKPIKEIGKRFKITWTQVRNVEKSAMDKLLVCPELQEVMNSFQVTFDSAVSI
jgi:DNA-directed RNA polymerase sigma subunit (sigma70/sigma32)